MRTIPHIRRYGLAVLSCAIALPLGWQLDAPSSCFFLAVMVSSLYGGKGPGLLSIGLSILAFDYFFMTPRFHFGVAPASFLRFIVFVGAVLLVNRLIAAKQNSDKARRQSDEYFRIVAETGQDAILSTDEHGKISFANPAATKIFGWEAENLIGQSLTRVMPAFSPDGHSGIMELVGLRKDGTEFFAEASFTEVLQDGRRSFTGFVRDVSERKQAQATLRKSESYLAEAQKLSHTGSFGLNVATGELFWSEETYQIVGYDAETKPTLELVLQRVHPEDQQRVQETLDLAIQSGLEWDFEHRFLMPDASVKHVHVVAHASRNMLKQLEYVGAVTDLSAAKRAEAELRASEEKYRELIQLSPDAIYVVDDTGILVSTNPAGLQMLRCSEEEASGLPMVETHLPEDRPGYLERLRQLKLGRSFQFERVFLRRDGATLPVEVSVSPIRHGFSQAVIRDISERKRAREALQRSEYYLAEAEKLSHTGSWAFDVPRKQLIYWSAESYRLEHRSPSKPLPTFEESRAKYSPEDWAMIVEQMERAIKERQDLDLEVRRTLPDGSRQNVRIVGHPVANDAGEVTELIGTTVDVTEQVEARAALKRAFDEIQRSEDQLRLIIDTIPALAWSMGPDGGFEFANRRWRDYTGLSIDEVMGWAWKSAIHADDLGHLLDIWSAALSSGTPSECEARLRRFDGEYRWFLFRTVPLHDEKGDIIKWYGTNTDIEDRKRAEVALRESEHNFRLIIDTIPALVWCAIPDGKLEYVNQRIVDVLGAPVSDLVEHGWTNFLHPDDVEPTLHAWFRAVASGTRHEVEYRMRCADGVYRWFHVLGQPLHDNEGRIVRWYGLLSDIEDQKNATEILRRTQARLSRATQIATVGEMAASIAHEVNQPLAAVVANGHACLLWLLTDPPNLTEASQAAERIVRDGNDAAEVVRRIRALFKQAEPEMIPLDLNDVVAEVVRLLKAEILRQGVVVETGLEEGLPPIMADRLQLQQVIFNLLMNGMEAMDALAGHPKKLVIQSRRNDVDTILIEIRDYGAGLKDLERPFEAFYTTKENGMGMGLAICRSIIDAHRGQLWVAHTEGPGTTFCFTLPFKADTSTRSPASPQSSDFQIS